jgi:N-acetyl-gamma-glutamylphosphate reductase
MIYLRTEEQNEVALTRQMVMIHDLNALAKTINGECGHGVSVFTHCLLCDAQDAARRYGVAKHVHAPESILTTKTTI